MVFHFHSFCVGVCYIDTICLIQTHSGNTVSYIVRYKYYVYVNNAPTQTKTALYREKETKTYTKKVIPNIFMMKNTSNSKKKFTSELFEYVRFF